MDTYMQKRSDDEAMDVDENDTKPDDEDYLVHSSSDEDDNKPENSGPTQESAEDDLYDASADTRNEQWLVNKVRKQIKSEKDETSVDDSIVMDSDATISCPMCFSVLSYQTQRHERYSSQYRAIFVQNIKVSTTERLVAKPPKHINRMMSEQGNTSFRSVECAVCGTQVAILEEEEEIYHFFQVIAG